MDTISNLAYLIWGTHLAAAIAMSVALAWRTSKSSK